MFRPNPLGLTDGYKPGHIAMLAPGTDYLYGTWIPRSLKYAPEGITKVLSAGQQLTWMWLHDQFEEYFFKESIERAKKFARDLSKYQGIPYNGKHFEALHELGYLPIRVKALPEGIETDPNIPHQTFINTVPGFAWLTLYLETPISNLSWKTPTNASTALQFRRNVTEWVMKTDSDNAWFIDYACHDFSARGLDPFTAVSTGLAHAFSFIGSDTLVTIDAARYFYGVGEDDVCIASVNASEHSVTCTGLFYFLRKLELGEMNDAIDEYYSFDIPATKSTRENPDLMAIAEWLNLRRWLEIFPIGILSVVSDTFDYFRVLTEIIPRLKKEILARDGKLVVRPDSGDPVDITCGTNTGFHGANVFWEQEKTGTLEKGTIEILWDIFGGTISKEGYKVLDSHIGAIYGDSINLQRQVQIYKRLAIKGFASTNIVLGVGSYTYQLNTRDTYGFAAKGAWFKTEDEEYDIYKDPATDNGTKKSLRGLVAVFLDENGEPYVKTQCTHEEEATGILQVIYENGKFFNKIDLGTIRSRVKELSLKY
jgi:nicotinamide phosphoribosyltransferase